MYVCVVGGANFDILSYSDDESTSKDSHVGSISFSVGGVGRNIAENLARLSIPTQFITAVSDDVMGQEVLKVTKQAGVDCTHVLIDSSANTSCYNAVLSSQKDLLYGISDMSVLSNITPEFIQTKKDIIAKARVCVLDTNIPQDTISFIVQKITGPQYVIDTVSATKAKKLSALLSHIFLIKTNSLELSSVVEGIDETIKDNQESGEDDLSLQEIHNNGRLMLSHGVKHLVVSLGDQGLWYESYDTANTGRYMPLSDSMMEGIQIQSTNGAGDAMCAGLVYSIYNNYSIQKAIDFGLAASIVTIQDKDTVSKAISKELLETTVRRIHEQQ